MKICYFTKRGKSTYSDVRVISTTELSNKWKKKAGLELPTAKYTALMKEHKPNW